MGDVIPFIEDMFPRASPPANEVQGVVPFRGRSAHVKKACEGLGANYLGSCCAICDWGAFVCENCDATEGEVPTDCPRREMTWDEKEDVLHGRRDYIVAAGGWVRVVRQGKMRCDDAGIS